MDDLIAHALGLGLTVKFRPLGRRRGELMRSGLVLINSRDSGPQQRIALAHECGHWVHGHDWTRDHDRIRDEREADTYAVRLLVTPSAYLNAEGAAGAHLGALARELDITPQLVLLWRESYLAEVGVVRRIPTRTAG